MHTLDSFVVQNLWEEASYDFVVPAVWITSEPELRNGLQSTSVMYLNS